MGQWTAPPSPFCAGGGDRAGFAPQQSWPEVQAETSPKPRARLSAGLGFQELSGAEGGPGWLPKASQAQADVERGALRQERPLNGEVQPPLRSPSELRRQVARHCGACLPPHLTKPSQRVRACVRARFGPTSLTRFVRVSRTRGSQPTLLVPPRAGPTHQALGGEQRAPLWLASTRADQGRRGVYGRRVRVYWNSLLLAPFCCRRG